MLNSAPLLIWPHYWFVNRSQFEQLRINTCILKIWAHKDILVMYEEF